MKTDTAEGEVMNDGNEVIRTFRDTTGAFDARRFEKLSFLLSQKEIADAFKAAIIVNDALQRRILFIETDNRIKPTNPPTEQLEISLERLDDDGMKLNVIIPVQEDVWKEYLKTAQDAQKKQFGSKKLMAVGFILTVLGGLTALTLTQSVIPAIVAFSATASFQPVFIALLVFSAVFLVAMAGAAINLSCIRKPHQKEYSAFKRLWHKEADAAEAKREQAANNQKSA